MAGDEHEIKLTNSNLENTSDPRPGFSLLLNKKHHHHYLTDAHIIGHTMQKFDPSTAAFVSLDRRIIGAVLLEDKLTIFSNFDAAEINSMYRTAVSSLAHANGGLHDRRAAAYKCCAGPSVGASGVNHGRQLKDLEQLPPTV